MTNEFARKLEEYLISECSDYDLSYEWQWVEDTQCCEVTISTLRHSKILNFRYIKNDLNIELSEDSFYVTREFDSTVKYFWMLVSPALFPEL